MNSSIKYSSQDVTSDKSTFQKQDFSFLQDFHNIIELILFGNNQDAIGKAVAQLEDRVEHARQVLEELPGLQYVESEQMKILNRELNILEMKKKQMKSYLSLPPFST
ncbi:hypothetical protein BDB01DRAFT_776065 [Pilobolus umbonatus]|nr:hypothetical protein BDB01DRAFT_776065 [Pilobolus umbonatus]